MKTFKQMCEETKKVDEADLGIVEPGLDNSDDEPYNTPIVEDEADLVDEVKKVLQGK